MDEIASIAVTVGMAILLFGIAMLTWLGWLPPSTSGTPSTFVDKRDMKNITLHAGMSGGIVFLLWILGHVLPMLSVATPWGAVAAAILSGLATWLRRFLKDSSGIVYPE